MRPNCLETAMPKILKAVLRSIFLFAVATLAGCFEIVQVAKRDMPVEDESLAAGWKNGSTTIKGTLKAQINSNTVRRGVFEVVSLAPATDTTRACAEILRKGWDPCELHLSKYTRTATTNGAGQFTFTRIGPGNYLVWAEIRWNYSRGKLGTGHVRFFAMAEVSVAPEDSELKVDLQNR